MKQLGILCKDIKLKPNDRIRMRTKNVSKLVVSFWFSVGTQLKDVLMATATKATYYEDFQQ